MARWTLRLDAAGVNAAMGMAFDGAGGVNRIRELEPGRLLIVQDFSPSMLRPGGSISGPTMMALADEATYALIFAHVGAELMAVTTSLNINFLKKPAPAALVAECRLLKIGKRLAVGEVSIRSEGEEDLVAHATSTYSIPPRG